VAVVGGATFSEAAVRASSRQTLAYQGSCRRGADGGGGACCCSGGGCGERERECSVGGIGSWAGQAAACPIDPVRGDNGGAPVGTQAQRNCGLPTGVDLKFAFLAPSLRRPGELAPRGCRRRVAAGRLSRGVLFNTGVQLGKGFFQCREKWPQRVQRWVHRLWVIKRLYFGRNTLQIVISIVVPPFWSSRVGPT
jgi:hypothetical protein